jgi:translation initiation factor IF-1
MSTSHGETRRRFDELKPGDRIEVEQTVVSEGKGRPERICGTVIRTERCQGQPCCRGANGTLSGDLILMELSDGELTTVRMDESTVLRWA